MSTLPPETSWTRTLGISALYVAIYVLLDWVSYIQPVLNLGITPWSPQTGLAMAFLLTMGIRWVPLVALGAFLAEVVVRDAPTPLSLLAGASIWIALTYGMLTHYLGRTTAREATVHLAQAGRFTVGVVVASLAAAVGYVGLFAYTGFLPLDSVTGSIARYWVGDINGILMLALLILAAPGWEAGWRRVRARWIEVLCQVALVFGLMWLLFVVNSDEELRFFYPLFVPMIWIAARWGAVGALLTSLTVQIGLVLTMDNPDVTTPVFDLQFLMLTLGLTGLFLGTVVTERANAWARVATGEAELRAVLATAPDAVLTANPEGEPRTSNAVARQLFGIPEDATSIPPLRVLLPQLDLRTDEGRLATIGARLDESTFPAEIAWVRLEPPARPGWLVIVRDTTERERTQTEARERDRVLARAMRFAVAGEMASALAHELNQPITALVSYLRASEILAAPLAPRDERLDATLSKAAKEAMRASEVLKRLRDFYTGGTQSTGPVSVADCCATVLRAQEMRLQNERITLTNKVPADLPRVECGDTQLEIILHNLLTNAIDAVSTSTRATRQITLHATHTGDRVLISVDDSGGGVAAQAMGELFEPFNTTKADGMGLGLAISRSLVRVYGGELACRRSAELGGASFEISLPVAGAPAARAVGE